MEFVGFKSSLEDIHELLSLVADLYHAHKNKLVDFVRNHPLVKLNIFDEACTSIVILRPAVDLVGYTVQLHCLTEDLQDCLQF